MHPDAIFWRVVNGELPLPPAAQTLGWQFLQYDKHRQEVSVAYDVPATLTNPLGNVQGGILSAMLDDSMGPAVYVGIPPNRIALTVESKTLFIRPASPGRILGTGRVEHRKGNLCFTAGELRNEAGQVLATATAVFRVSRLRWHGLTVPAPLATGLMKWKLRQSRS